ncbi:MAG: membrane protein insertion efficiency factor YidD [Kofleriaceae bacterium]
MLSRILLAPIRFYRRYLSGLKRAPTCRFLPTCSEYAIEAIERRGPIVGFGKAVWRILRCNPLCKGGYDPVERDPATPARCGHGTTLATEGSTRGQG